MKRNLVEKLVARLGAERGLMQVVAGPRQVGKTTAVRQALEELGMGRMVSADEPLRHDSTWLRQQWEVARAQARQSGRCVLAVDEIQKVANWSESVKRLWDEDTRDGLDVRVVLLGSSQMLLQRGLTESLAGRFELLRATHWSWPEMREAFGWDWQTYVHLGGYPGAARFRDDLDRWRDYVRFSLVETMVTRDVLMENTVHKPALLRTLFELGCASSGQELSLTKLLGQLQDAGNTVTLAHYLSLLESAGMLSGLQKFAVDGARKRNSVPKFQVHNNALAAAVGAWSWPAGRDDPETWGRMVESAVGAHLLNSAVIEGWHLAYWREGGKEVDFVLSRGDRLLAIEVKSGRRKGSLAGMSAFLARHPRAKPLLVGADGIAVEEFLAGRVSDWL